MPVSTAVDTGTAYRALSPYLTELRLFAPNRERASQISPKLIAEWYHHLQTGAQIRKPAQEFLTCQKNFL